MAQIEFQYNGIITVIQCQEDQKMSDIFHNFTFKSNINENEINYSYNGKIITQSDKNLTFNQIANKIDKERKKMNILVISNKEPLDDKTLVRSKNIICPKCKENIKMKINNYKINLYGCKNKHKFNKILLNEFEKTQMINLNEIKCNLCNQNKSSTYNNKLYKCNDCNIIICPLCQLKHDKNHNIIDYDKIYYLCNKHEEPFTNYCKKCKKNICSLCEKEHINHEMILLRDLIIDKKDLLNKINEIKKSIDIYNDNINKIIEILNNIKNYINNYYKLIEFMANNYNEKERNYEILNNINEIINNNKIINDINIINNENNIKNKFNNIYDIYNIINSNEIKLKTKIEKDDIGKHIYFLDNTHDKIKVGLKDGRDGNKEDDYITEEHHHDFLQELNESNVELYINDKKYNFRKYFIPDKEGEYNILLKINILMKDCSFMFYGCSNLTNIDLSTFNTENVTNMMGMFAECSNLINLDLSSFNTKNVTDMYYMFYGCKNLNNINLSSFNTQKVIYMHNMFNGCESLKNLDLSSFNTPNLESMYGMFQNCFNLETLDLSSFNTKKNQFDFNNMFTKCTKLQRVVLSSNADELNEIIKSDLGSYFKNDIITYA